MLQLVEGEIHWIPKTSLTATLVPEVVVFVTFKAKWKKLSASTFFKCPVFSFKYILSSWLRQLQSSLWAI